MMLLLGLAIILLALGFFVLLLGGNVYDFTDLMSLLLIIFPLLGILTATRSFKLFYTGFRAVIFPKETVSEKLLRQAISLFRLMSKAAVAMSAIHMLIGFIIMLKNLDFSSASVASLGVNISMSLVPLVYGVLFAFAVFEPVVFILKKRLAISRAQRKEIL